MLTRTGWRRIPVLTVLLVATGCGGDATEEDASADESNITLGTFLPYGPEAVGTYTFDDGRAEDGKRRTAELTIKSVGKQEVTFELVATNETDGARPLRLKGVARTSLAGAVSSVVEGGGPVELLPGGIKANAARAFFSDDSCTLAIQWGLAGEPSSSPDATGFYLAYFGTQVSFTNQPKCLTERFRSPGKKK